jgi:predicted KAP-like P-loop ATPase
MAASLKPRLLPMPRTETSIIMDRLLERARQEQDWGVPDILEACLAVSEADPSQGTRLAAFLSDLPPGQIKPSIVPKIADQPWAKSVFDGWLESSVSTPVKRAIKQRS